MNIFKNRPLAACCFVFVFSFFIAFYISPIVKAALVIATIGVCVAFFKKRLYITIITAFIILGVLFGYFYFDQYVAKASQLPENRKTEIEIVDISFSNDSVAYFDGIEADGSKIHYTVYDPPEIEIGDVICGDITYKEIEHSDDFDLERYYNSKDIWIEGEIAGAEIIGHNDNILNDIIYSIHDYCKDIFKRHTNDMTYGVLSALAIGDRSGIDESISRDFNRAGLSHMLAISGMHLSVIMSCIVMFAEVLRIDERISSGFVIIICICYIFVAGASSSILRAGIMFIMMSLGSVLRRMSDSLTNLMVSVTLIILFSPSSVFDTGLILSFTATLGIVTIVGNYIRRVQDKLCNLLGKLWRCIVISFVTTLSAHAFSFIPMLLIFDSISVISILSNLSVTPLITVVLFGIPVLLVTSRIPYVGSAVGCILELFTGAMVWVAGKLSSIPNCLIQLGYPFVSFTLIAIALGVVLIFIFRRRNAYIMPYLCWFVAFTLAFSVYNLKLMDKYDVVMYSEASSDAIIMRNLQGTIYVDLGKGSGASEKRAFNVIKGAVYSNELDGWVITDYSNNIVRHVDDYMNEYYIRSLYLPMPYDAVSETAAKELEYYAECENVRVFYYDYGCSFMINNADICIYEPVKFEDSSVSIPSADIKLGTRKISYVGCGYFDYRDSEEKYDILYVGEFGTKRKQKQTPEINCEESYIAEGNEISSENIENKRFVFSDKYNKVKLRISR